MPKLHSDTSADLNDRQLWILAEIGRGVHVRRPMVEKRFGVVAKSAQRDLTQLASRGRIEYVRIGRSGYYRTVTNRTLLHGVST